MVAKLATRLAALEVAAEGLRAAGLNRGHRAVLHGNQAVCRLIRRPKAREHLGQFYLIACRLRTVRMRAHGALAARGVRAREQVQRRGAARQVLLRQMEVARGGR